MNFLCGLAFPTLVSAQFFNDYTVAPHHYWEAEIRDPMTLWLRDVEAGRVKLADDEQTGRKLVERLLQDLNVPVSSQVMVFSKTSLQRRPVKPDNPRAIYFNDEVYIGWMPGGRIEISSFDPEIGSVFYFQRDFDDSPDLPLFYRDRVCIQCHAGSATNFIPGPMGKSVFPDERGQPTQTVMSFELAGHDVDFKDRWGGWYVSGDHGTLRHMGNALVEAVDGKRTIDREKYANVASLEAFFPGDKYPGKGSDVLALMVMDHQITMHYRLTEAHYRVRQAIFDQAAISPTEEARSDYEAELATATEMVVSYLLFCDEVPLGGEAIAQDSTYRDAFLESRKLAEDGRSLRDLNLQDQLFQYRCSYMIYSQAFHGLPAPLKSSIFDRLKQLLDPDSQEEAYAHLATGERKAILTILNDTLPEFRNSGTAGL